MNSKKCVFCESLKVTKQGFQKGIQKWKCKDCLQYFQSNKKSLPKEEIFCSFVFHKQTFKELLRNYQNHIIFVTELYKQYLMNMY